MAKYDFSNLAVNTSLSANINSSVTSLTVADATGYPTSNFKIWVNSEIIFVGSRTGTTFSSLQRGYDGTTAASHTSGDAVRHVITAEDLETRLLGVPATSPGTTEDEKVLVYDHDTVSFKWENAATFGSGFLPLAGGSMSGNIDLNGNELVEVQVLSSLNTDLFIRALNSGAAGQSIRMQTDDSTGTLRDRLLIHGSSGDIQFLKNDGTNVFMFWDQDQDELQMVSDLDMGGYVLRAPSDPTLGTHVGDRDYNDARYLLLAGGTMTGDLNAGTNNVVNVGNLDFGVSGSDYWQWAGGNSFSLNFWDDSASSFETVVQWARYTTGLAGEGNWWFQSTDGTTQMYYNSSEGKIYVFDHLDLQNGSQLRWEGNTTGDLFYLGQVGQALELKFDDASVPTTYTVMSFNDPDHANAFDWALGWGDELVYDNSADELFVNTDLRFDDNTSLLRFDTNISGDEWQLGNQTFAHFTLRHLDSSGTSRNVLQFFNYHTGAGSEGDWSIATAGTGGTSFYYSDNDDEIQTHSDLRLESGKTAYNNGTQTLATKQFRNITVGTTAPSSPSTGDVWIDTT